VIGLLHDLNALGLTGVPHTGGMVSPEATADLTKWGTEEGRMVLGMGEAGLRCADPFGVREANLLLSANLQPIIACMRTPVTGRRKPPRLVAGRRGGISIVDALVEALWLRRAERNQSGSGEEWPSLGLEELHKYVLDCLKYNVASASVRSAIYNHPEIFERASTSAGRVAYRLSPWAREQR
jgi:hypothetical protein